MTTPSTRIDVKWSPPMPDPVPGMRHDPGGYIYRLYRDGALLMSGSAHHVTAETVGVRAARYAAEKGLHCLPVVILSRNPLEVAP